MKKKDLSHLARFCKTIQHDEISLETWETCMTALDLTVPVFITPAEADSGTDKTVAFSRTITASETEKPRREAASVLVTIPPKAANGLQLKCSGLGDARCDRRGDLLVIVRVKI